MFLYVNGFFFFWKGGWGERVVMGFVQWVCGFWGGISRSWRGAYLAGKKKREKKKKKSCKVNVPRAHIFKEYKKKLVKMTISLCLDPP